MKKFDTLINFLLENTSERMTPKETFDYVNELHLEGISKEPYEDLEWLEEHKYFELIEVKISSLIYNTAIPPIYKNEIEGMPPPVVSHDWYVMDGNHRVSSLKFSGEQMVWVYKGAK